MVQSATYNINGTVHSSFKISTTGPTLYQGNNVPGGGNYREGDIWISHTNQGKFYQYKGGSWIEVGQTAQSNFNIVGSGNSVTTMNVLNGVTTGSGAGELFFDGVGGTQRLTLANDSVNLIEADFAGISIDGGNQYSAGYNIKGVVTNFNGNVSFSNYPAETIYAESNSQWLSEMQPGSAGSNLLRFLCYGEPGKTIHWTVFARVTTSVYHNGP